MLCAATRGARRGAGNDEEGVVAIVRSNEAPTFDLQGSTVTGLAAPARGAVECMTYKVALPAGGALPHHRHDHEEVFYLASGSVTTVLDGVAFDIERGDTVIIPAGVVHHSVAGGADAELIVAMPSGTKFIRPDGDESIPPWGE
jgi:quercetin dioxygenase-like cupin family protein